MESKPPKLGGPSEAVQFEFQNKGSDLELTAPCLAPPYLTPPLTSTIPESNAENLRAVCCQSRCSSPFADGQTQDARHEEQRAQSVSPTLPPGDIFCPRLPDGPSPKTARGSDSGILSPAQPVRAKHPQKGVRRNTGVRRERL